MLDILARHSASGCYMVSKGRRCNTWSSLASPSPLRVRHYTGSTGTYRCKRLSARGCASENDVRVVVLVNAEKSLKRRFVTKTAGQLKSERGVSPCCCRTTSVLIESSLQLLYSERFHMLPSSNQRQQVAHGCSAQVSTAWDRGSHCEAAPDTDHVQHPE